MKSMFVHCPHCEQESELFLISSAFMIILNCPGCHKPLMYYYGKTFLIDDVEINKLYKNNSVKNISKFLESLNVKKTGSGNVSNKVHTQTRRKKATHKPGVPVREEVITSDDIINLKIDLAHCCSVEDFLKTVK
ncbi:MAG: hypothetical protein ABIA63_09735 [bacterium]